MKPGARSAAIGLMLAAIAPSPAIAGTLAIDLPAGTVSAQVLALGRLAQISVVVTDPGLWSKPVPALRGRMSALAAIRLIAARCGGEVEPIDAALFRLVPKRTPLPRAHPARPRPPVPAVPPPEPPAPDIVVVGSKRDLPLGRVAGQVMRVSGQDLEFGGAGGTERLTSRLSTVASTYLGAGRNKLFIRGIADSSFTGPTQATVGQYFGDLRLSYNAPDPDLRLADLAAVEVLAGPQGTLYGAGSLGGLIRLVPNPVELGRTSGSVAIGASATQHGAPGYDAQGVLNVPIVTDRLGVRLVATSVEEGGYIDKPLLGRHDVNTTRIDGGRGTVHLKIADDWSAELIGIGQRIRGDDSQYADRGARPLTRNARVVEGFGADFGQGQFVLSGKVGDVRLRSSTGVTAHDLTERYDATLVGDDPTLFTQANRTRMVANETRGWVTNADGSGWLLGMSFTDNRTRLSRAFMSPGERQQLPGVSNAVREITAYGEASIRAARNLLLTGGLRVSHSVLTGAAEDGVLQNTPEALATLASRREVSVLPSASALVDAGPNAAMYLRYQQGFRPGGLTIYDGDVQRFNNDHVGTIEAGYRFGRAARDPFAFSFTVAHTGWRNIQADFLDGGGFPSTANVGNGDIWTVETTASARLARGLRIDAAISLNDSSINERAPKDLPVAGSSGGPVGAAARLGPIPNIANVTARVGMTYDAALSDHARLKVDGWARYVGVSRLGLGPELGEEQGNLVDSGITARVGWDRFGVTIGVTNLTDARGNRFALGTPFLTGRAQVTPLRPRTVRIGFDTAF
ncbi:iron complex outermembrane receptor protein [Sphingomonas sp. SORGH_AS802]|uniref:TonB-dependent receptor n=1 Tax=unclassified Sphingomonas TaxID=196159 RepID=UPI002866F17F|nr:MULTISPECIES: TonB-dependent receptor [unclassified Sphingomonas]MDR6126072.1 iron complex outermembrane receptor protein [Sphingomonas sp. SORGH_AS_0438]MDR6136622.1 iron complex outermembrane receptor protein [Sphingomonas sp. SORGH_AS_0802]